MTLANPATTNRAQTEAQHSANSFVTESIPPSSTISTITREGEEIGRKADAVPFLLPGADTVHLAGGAPVAAAGSFPDRFCEFCGTPLHRKKTEQRTHWGVRRYCDKLCSKRGSAARQREAFARLPTPDRCCMDCDKPLVRREHEKRSNFLVRRFCTPDCSKAFYKKTKRRRAEAVVVEGNFPRPKDAGKEAALYAAQGYTDSPRAEIDYGTRWMPPRLTGYVFSMSTAAMAAL